MEQYRELLQITEEIEQLLRCGVLDTMNGIQDRRQKVVSRLQVGGAPSDSPLKAQLIRKILKSEERCVELAITMKKKVLGRMKRTGQAKKLHNAYGRQVLSH